MAGLKKLGDKLGVSGKQISNYESGALMPPMDILIKLCEVYECELEFLLNERVMLMAQSL